MTDAITIVDTTITITDNVLTVADSGGVRVVELVADLEPHERIKNALEME